MMSGFLVLAIVTLLMQLLQLESLGDYLKNRSHLVPLSGQRSSLS